MKRARLQKGRDDRMVLLAVFLTSAPIGALWMMAQSTPQGWAAALLASAFAGAVSVGWAYTFIKERWWLLAVVVPGQILIPSALFGVLQRAGVFDVGMSLSVQARIIVLAVMCVILTTAGFTLFIVHLRLTERRSARALAELDLAHQMHETLVPPLAVTTAIAEVYGRSTPSNTMGGDLIDTVAADDRLDILLGDVSGHGVGAGIVMAMIKSAARTRLRHRGDLGEVLTDLNRVLADLTASNIFATFVLTRLHLDGRLEYALAGHLPLFHYHRAVGRWEQYPNESLPLGIEPDERFVSGTSRVAPGDILAVFTDGLTEVLDAKGRELGLEGVAALLARHSSNSVQEMFDSVMAGVAKHGSQADDQTLLLIRVPGAGLDHNGAGR